MTPCCPENRRLRAVTRDGRPVADLHRHGNALRGVVAGEARAREWFPNGRLTPLSETDLDLMFGSAR